MTQRSSKLRNVVGPKVRALRDRHGWSQPVFAAKCQLQGWNASRDIIARIELQIRWVSDFELILLARALQVSPTDLLPSRLDLSQLALTDGEE